MTAHPQAQHEDTPGDEFTLTPEVVMRQLARRVLAARGVDYDHLTERRREEAARPPLHERLPLEKYLRTLLPDSFTSPMAQAHREMWEWARTIQPGVYVPAFVGVWPRGYGKSTNGEAVVVDVAARGARNYVMYVRRTQTMANESVENIGRKLRSPSVRHHYPTAAQSRTTAGGREQAWKQSRVVTPTLVIDAMGLDTARRGAKVEDDRPDFIILDDIDGKNDSPDVTKKVITTITDSILGMLADHGCVLVLQNLIIPNGFVSQLAGVGEHADFLSDRIVSGPYSAVTGLVVEPGVHPDGRPRHIITGGVPTWPEGMGLDRCQAELDTLGWEAWDREKQNNVSERKNALWSRAMFQATRRLRVPERLEWVTVGVDPPADTGTCGIVVVGGAREGDVVHTYTLDDRSTPPGSGPATWARAVVQAYAEWEADDITVEVNNGGAMVKHAVRTVLDEAAGLNGRATPVHEVRATRGKYTRAQPVAVRMSEGLDHHVGVHTELEAQCSSYVPGDKDSPDRMDAKVWATVRVLERLGAQERRTGRRAAVAVPDVGGVAQGAKKRNAFRL